VGREKETRLIPASKPKKVLVIGGGPSGMKAAEIAARRGHQVTLYERSQNLGGALRLAATPPKKEIMLTIIDYLQRQLIQLQVPLIMNQEVSPRMVDEIKPDVVIVATGARPYLPAGIKGIRNVGVLTPEQALSETANLGQKVAVVGAGGIGAEIADYLSERGKDVTLIEMRTDIAMDIPSHLQYHLLKRLREKDVRILTSTRAIEFRRGTITIQDGMGKRPLRGFDSIVTALGAKSDDRIARALKAKKIKLYTIGDAKEPGEIREALTDGENVALRL
jgi:pyruvate/2-oxoglutarate dehydrogenase complex dihydrolipoamide dehydrogenase (E3) component